MSEERSARVIWRRPVPLEAGTMASPAGEAQIRYAAATVTTQLETDSNKALRSVLDQTVISEDTLELPVFGEFEMRLERLLPDLFEAKFEWWRGEAFDGADYLYCRRSGADELELRGLVIFLNNMCWTPIWLRISPSRGSAHFERIRCRIGVNRPDGSLLTLNSDDLRGQLARKLGDTVATNPETLSWHFEVDSFEIA